VIVDVCSDSSLDVTRSRRDAATRTIRRQAFTSLTASGVSPARAWTRTAHVPSDSRINTTRGKESRRTLFVWQSQCRGGSPQNRGIPTLVRSTCVRFCAAQAQFWRVRGRESTSRPMEKGYDPFSAAGPSRAARLPRALPWERRRLRTRLAIRRAEVWRRHHPRCCARRADWPGARISFVVGLTVVSVWASLGTLLRAMAGYFGGVIALLVLGFNFLGDGLRDVTDPKS